MYLVDSGGQFTQLYKWVPGYGQWWTVQSAVNEYLGMDSGTVHSAVYEYSYDSGGQFIHLYKWVPGYGQWWTVHSAV